MTIDATFWVAISFFIFVGGLIYLKVPHKVNNSLINQINEISRELDEAKKSLFTLYFSELSKIL